MLNLDKLFIDNLNFDFENIQISKNILDDISHKKISLKIDNIKIIYSFKNIKVIYISAELLYPLLIKITIKALEKEYKDAIFIFTNFKDDSSFNEDDLIIELVINCFNSLKRKYYYKILRYNGKNGKKALFEQHFDILKINQYEQPKSGYFLQLTAPINPSRITKKFYTKYKSYLHKLAHCLKGIPDISIQDKLSFSSVFINRIMFIFFIMKRGFINNDQNYLLTKYKEYEKTNFYKDFLVPLFFIGFSIPQEEWEKLDTRDKTLIPYSIKLGNVPFLSERLFVKHPLEKQNINIQLENKIIKEILLFLNKYTWYLDVRELKNENYINPEIIGHVFEQYINQKELGAYYTKEDITEYISKNTIIPYIFDQLGENNYQDYIAKCDICQYVYNDIDNYSDRLNEIKTLYNNGKITNINDFIINNLNIVDFTHDFIGNLKDTNNDRKILHSLYVIITSIKILDPTSGSGEFLFGALNILFPLYNSLILKIKTFKSEDLFTDIFEKVNVEINNSPNKGYFIVKNIILNNLFGVDIMEEAIEILKLRLFLRLISEKDDINKDIEPLPDIDFNIKSGNTLVGMLSIEQLIIDLPDMTLSVTDLISKINKLNDGLINYKVQQLKYHKVKDSNKLKRESLNKIKLMSLIEKLNDEINRNYCIYYGVNNHVFVRQFKPFNWYIEFFDVINSGGFDIIIGNPPYIEYNKIKLTDNNNKIKNKIGYNIKGYTTDSCGNLYSFVIERSILLNKDKGRFGMIVPISLPSTSRMKPLRNQLSNISDIIFCSNYADRPGCLFNGVHQKLSIIITKKKSVNPNIELFTSNYFHWYSKDVKNERQTLFNNIRYTHNIFFASFKNWLKIGNPIEISIVKKMYSEDKSIKDFFQENNTNEIHLNMRMMYWAKCFRGNKMSKEYKSFYFKNSKYANATMSILNSSVFFYFWEIFSDCWHITQKDLESFRCNIDKMNNNILDALDELAKELEEDLENNKNYVGTIQTKYEYYTKKSKHIIDKIDIFIGEHYSFTKDEFDFIKNYNLKYRIGSELDLNTSEQLDL